MSIREKGYHPWSGTLIAKPHHWFPIVRFSIKQIYQKRFAKVLFAIELIPFLVFLFFSYILYIANRPDMAFVSLLKELPAEVKTLDYFFHSFYCFGTTVFFHYIILSLFCGSDLISADIRSNAFPLYFSKPLSPLDYLLGKFIALLFFLLLFSLVPGLLLLLLKLAFSGFDGISLRLIIGIVAFPLITASFMSLFTLWVSSLSSNSRWVKIIFFLFLFGLLSLSGILTGISGGDTRFMLFDISTNISQTGHFFFHVKSNIVASPWISVLILVFTAGTLFYLVARKIKRIEV